MIRFRREIEQRGREELAPYLDRELPGITPRYLSQVVTKFNRAIEERYDKAAEFDGEGRGLVPPGFPWITPVLGSGAVDHALAEDGAPLRNRCAAIEAQFDGEDRLPDNVTKGELARRFADALIRERVGETWDPEGPSSTSETPTTDALITPTANLLLAAALLTRLYDGVAAARGAPIPRWEGDSVALPTDVLRFPEIKTSLVEPAMTVLQQLMAWHADPVTEAASRLGDGVIQLLDDRLHELDRVTPRLVSLADLRLLTECAWFYLQRDCLTYPGWSDLMLELAVPYTPIHHQDGRPRPLYNRVSLSGEQIGKQYRQVARTSWARRQASTDSQPTIYDLVASVLSSQARLEDSNPGPTAVPLATGFVTGFDLELELALLARRQRFVLALPVVAATGPRASDISILWIRKDVDPSQTEEGGEIEALWSAPSEVFSGAGGSHPHELRGVPIVVRLAGCPAIALPGLSEDKKLRNDVCQMLGWDREPTAPELEPLFVLDEYIASAMGAIETFLDHLDDKKLGLPRGLAGVPGGVNARFARFWLVAGVQLSDSSIRQRLVAQLAANALSAPESPCKPERTGLTVNLRIGPLDGRLMQWQGFDIVQDDCNELLKHLAHYERHLESPLARCSPEGTCPLT